MTEPTPTPTRAPLFDRLMLASLVPALFLPILAALLGVLGALTRESLGGGAEGISSLIVAVFMFVLLGSMTLNAWLLLRHPQTLRTAALPRRTGIALAVLYGLLLVWIVLLAAGVFGGAGIGFGLAIMVVSIVVFGFAVVRYLRREDAAALESTQLPGWGRAAAVAYLVLAAVAIVFAVASPFVGAGWSDAGGVLGGPATWMLLLLGLPWSHPLYSASVLLLFAVAPELGLVPTALALLSVVVNVVLVVQLLVSSDRRTRIANWFFRLRRATPAPEAPPAA